MGIKRIEIMTCFSKGILLGFLLSCIFLYPGSSFASIKTITWENYSVPFNTTFSVGKLKTGFREVELVVELPEELLRSSKKIPLLITAYDADPNEYASVRINGSFWANYTFATGNDSTSTASISIKAKHLKPGLNKFLFSNHEPHRYWYRVKKIQFENVEPKFKRILKSMPSGAEIYIDNTYHDTTPNTVTLTRGYHQLKLKKNGYKDFEQKIFVSTSKTSHYELEELDSVDIPITDNVKTSKMVDVDTPSFSEKISMAKSQNAEKNANAIAVVIGNQTYSHKDVPAVSYASNDALAMKKYLIDILGYKDGNIIFEMDISKAGLEKIFGTKENHRGLLYNYIKPEKSDVFIYYSGHGSPDPNTNKAYIVPIDCDPVMMDLTAYPLDTLYGNLPKIEAKSVIVVIDACFSGGTNSGEWLVPNASPALLKISNPATIQNNITIFTSSEDNQVSSWYPEKKHSMFTYFFLQAVTGEADINKDKKITFQEIHSFVSDRADGVPYYAKRLHGGRIQTPTMHTANKNTVFLKY